MTRVFVSLAKLNKNLDKVRGWILKGIVMGKEKWMPNKWKNHGVTTANIHGMCMKPARRYAVSHKTGRRE